MFKRILDSIIESQMRIGRIRAAAYLAQMGYHEEAKKVMLTD